MPQSHTPIERRGNVAVNDLQLRGLDLRLIGADCSLKLIHQGLLRVDLLLRNAAGGNQRRITLQVQLGVAQLRLVTKQLRLHLIELSLEGTRVNLNEQFALLDVLPLSEVYVHDLPVDPALDVGGIECRHRTQACQVNGNVLALHRRDGDRDGMRPSGLRLLLLGVGTTATANERCAYCRKDEKRDGGRGAKLFTRARSIRKINHIHRLVRHRSVSAQARQEARVLDVSIVGSVAGTLPRKAGNFAGGLPIWVDQVGTNASSYAKTAPIQHQLRPYERVKTGAKVLQIFTRFDLF